MYKRILTLLLAVVLALPLSMIPAGAASATGTLTAFEKRTVRDDLTGGVIDGEEFDVSSYPYVSESTSMMILTFLEYGYSDFAKSDPRYTDYSLFVYVYNPGNLSVSKRDKRHSITLKVGNGESYQKYPMELLSCDGDGTHNELYLKFKVNISANELREKLGGATERVYQLSEMEIVSVGDTNATAYEGGKWTFSGYSEGYGKTGSPALTVKNEKLDGTVVINNIGQGVYRKAADNTDFLYTQIDSVFFTIPHEITDKYGENLIDIFYEYYAYDSGWMVGFEHDKPYNLFRNQQGVVLEEPTSELPQIHTEQRSDGNITYCYWTYNYRGFAGFPANSTDLLTYVFRYAPKSEAGTIVDTDVKNYFSDEWSMHEKGENSVFDMLTAPEGEKIHQQIHSKDLDYKLNTFDGNWWEKLWNCSSGYETMQVPPIQIVKKSDLDDVASNLWLNEKYKDDLSYMYHSAAERGDKTYIFHFAASDYYSGQVWCSSYLWDGREVWITGDDEGGFVCRENLYMDFDMLEMTFERDGVQSVLPVQMSPVNVIGELQLPDDYKSPEGLPRWLVILIVIVIILVVLVLMPVLTPVLKPLLSALGWVIALPFRFLWWLLKAVGKGISALFRKIGEAISSHKK